MPRRTLSYGWLLEFHAFGAGLLDTEPVLVPMVVEPGSGPACTVHQLIDGRVERVGFLAWRASSRSVRYEYRPPVDYLAPWRFSAPCPPGARRVLRDPGAPAHAVLDALLSAVATPLRPKAVEGDEFPTLDGWLLYPWIDGPLTRHASNAPHDA